MTETNFIAMCHLQISGNFILKNGMNIFSSILDSLFKDDDIKNIMGYNNNFKMQIEVFSAKRISM